MVDLDEYYSLETIFRKQSYPVYYATLHDFADSLDANEEFRTKKPDWVPGGDTFRQHVTTMKEYGIAADRGDSLHKEQRQAVRDQSELDMDSAVSLVRTIAIAKKDPSFMHTLNLPQKETHQKSSRKVLSQNVPIDLKVKHAKDVPGGIVIEGTHVRSGGPYLVQLCKGEVVSEDSWYNPGGHHKSCAKIRIQNLERAATYYIRMRTDGPDGPGPWSNVVSIIVL